MKFTGENSVAEFSIRVSGSLSEWPQTGDEMETFINKFNQIATQWLKSLDVPPSKSREFLQNFGVRA